jgi:hypothetical protein
VPLSLFRKHIFGDSNRHAKKKARNGIFFFVDNCRACRITSALWPQKGCDFDLLGKMLHQTGDKIAALSAAQSKL